jgi:hypothetical protein
MKTVFDQHTRNELVNRISTLDEKCARQWGKMNVYQMTQHCILWDEMILQNKKFKRPLIGVLLGKLFLKNEMKDRPMRQNNPTIPELIVREPHGNIAANKQQWIALMNEYASYSPPDTGFIHPFFGKMTKEQIGYHAYKHADHHLRQFNS